MANNGTIVGTPTFAAGKFGVAASGFSSSSLIQLPAAFATLPPTTCALEAWLKYTSNGSTQVAVMLGQSTGYWLGASASGNLIGSNKGISGGGLLDSGISIADGAWHHCVLAISPSAISPAGATFFVDGVPGTFTAGTGLTPDNATGLIGGFSTGGFVWAGAVDEVAIWKVTQYTGAYTTPVAAYSGSETNLVSVYHLNSDATDSGTTAAATFTYTPSSTTLKFSPANWGGIGSGVVSTVNPGAYIETLFSGTTLTLNYDGSAATASNYPRIAVFIDGHETGTFTLTNSSTGALAIATGLANRQHLLRIVLRSVDMTQARWATPAAMLRITGITVGGTSTVTAAPRRTKTVLCYGDSITEGYNAIGNTGNTAADQDALADYAYAVGLASDAEVGIIAFTGQGLTTTGNGAVPIFGTTYASVYSGVARDFTTQAPDLIVINQGTNDTSGSWIGPYTTIVTALLTAAPNAKILLLVPFNQTHASDITAVVAAVNNARVTAVATSGWWPTVGTGTDSIDGTHPYGYEHLAVIAPKLFAVVQTTLYPTTTTTTGRSNTFY